MEVLVKFVLDNYIYFIFVLILLVLALIGYVVDSSKETKHQKELASKLEETDSIPITLLNSNVKLGTSVNKLSNNSNTSVNSETGDISNNEPPVQPKIK